jgi:hypothetical protein
VFGNHDPRQKCKAAFGPSQCRDQYDTKCVDMPCFVSHYPHAYWPASHYGSFHVFGHVHDQRTDTLTEKFPDARMMDVGVDAANRWLGKYTCFSEEEVYNILIAKTGHDHVKFYQDLQGINYHPERV